MQTIQPAQNNAELNKRFLSAVTLPAKAQILGAIAKHYGVSIGEIYDELTDADAEHLLDYMTGNERAATSVLMQKHGFK